MLSDDTSSDSETGRFKCKSKPEEDKKSDQKQDLRSLGRSRRAENERAHRGSDRRRDDRDNLHRDRFRHSRHSPGNRRRRSREGSPVRRRSHERRLSRGRSPGRRSHERHRANRDSGMKSKIPNHRSSSNDRHRHSRSRSHLRTADHRRDLKDEVKHNIPEVSSNKFNRKTRESISLSPDPKGKKSEIYKPSTPTKRKSDSPVIVVEEVQESSDSEEVQPGSYYNMIPAVVKEKSEESSEIDSSDDEKLRAKLLNLEKKLNKTKKKKHRKKHKRKSSKSKEREHDGSLSVEVSSTTDIKDKNNPESPSTEPAPEVTSTQKTTSKESSEEGEILSDEDSQKEVEIDASDLRHKLKQSRLAGSDEKMDVCGPALPPHLQGRYEKNNSLNMEGPALPPRLQSGSRNIGPSISNDMRKILAEKEREIIKYESSDEDYNMGPLPEGAEGKWSNAHKRLEQRAMAIKIRQLEGHGVQGPEVKSREKWMLELPEAKAKYLGLEARTFRAKEGPDMSDRSSWTDTPEDKAKKAAGQVIEDPDVIMKREAKARQIADRDTEQEEAVKKHKKKHKREESLLELHQKKLKKKKKKEDKEDGKKERRPFSREVDMQVNRFDEAQKKSIIKKAQDLDGRFSKGEAKYL
ncbi:GPALPP motifs-containing protein 1 [Manduca sexta]|uniref:GPALPP motifs-containing protein 1 n=1 Tax=Manduca sexta TaxID=7130 RepID=UPI00188F7C1B|nr:GPALPP motifs-containing protein 1 [Manduca sexta]